MLISISTTYQPATDLGFLLHKNPAKVNSFNLPFGKCLVFYPAATHDFCEAVFLLDINPIDLVRNRKYFDKEGFSLHEYINDRPYVASSFTSVALAQVFGSALAGRSKDRPELALQKLPLKVKIEVVPCKGGETILRRLFEPLGYAVEATPILLDATYPEWGYSRYFSLVLSHTCTVQELLTHLYVLLPVLDDEKHYWIGESELEKLLKYGEGWLQEHPEKELITSRYLKHQNYLINDALALLRPDPENESAEEDLLEKKISLHDHRLDTIVDELKALNVKKILDLGCGEGKLLKRLLKEKLFDSVTGMDVSLTALHRAKSNLNIENLPDNVRSRLQIFLGSLMYRDERLSGSDAAVASEVIEHLDPFQLESFEKVVFEHAKPKFVIITTPNSEYNALFPTLSKGSFRHQDHRFEWNRNEFQTWAKNICELYGYRVLFKDLGPSDPSLGAPSQMAIFEL